MGRRNRLQATAKTREKIRTAVILSRLQNHTIATPNANTGLLPAKNRMLPTQIKAAEVLLDRTLPRLQATVLTGDPDAPIRAELGGTIDVKASPALEAAFRKMFEEKF